MLGQIKNMARTILTQMHAKNVKVSRVIANSNEISDNDTDDHDEM